MYGVVRVTPSQIEEYSLSDIWAAYIGYWRNEQLKGRAEWERTRFAAFYSVALHSKQINKQKDLIEFDWEIDKSVKGTKANPWTRAELEELRKTHPFYKKK